MVYRILYYIAWTVVKIYIKSKENKAKLEKDIIHVAHSLGNIMTAWASKSHHLLV